MYSFIILKFGIIYVFLPEILGLQFSPLLVNDFRIFRIITIDKINHVLHRILKQNDHILCLDLVVSVFTFICFFGIFMVKIIAHSFIFVD